MTKMRLLLTGGNGFIGKNILEQLNSNYKIIAPKHSELNLVNTNEVDRFFLHNSIDFIIHAAFIGVQENRNNARFVEENIRMQANILKQSIRVKKIICIGSGAEYDKSRPLCQVKEKSFGEKIPSDSYGFSKYINSLLAQSYADVITIRPFGVYGKYESEQRFISYAIRQVLNGEPIKIKQNSYFDYLYIDDLIQIVDWMMTHSMNHSVYNLGSDKRRNLLSIVQILFKTVGKEVPVDLEDQNMGNEYTANNSRLLSEMKTFSYTKLRDGINMLYSYYSKQKIY